MDAAVNNSGVLCVHKKTCENCGALGTLLHSGLSDRLFDAPGKWDLLRCPDRACGLIWLDPQPLPEQIGKLYGRYYTHAAHQHAEAGLSYESRGSTRIFKRMLARLFFWKAALFRSDYLHLEGLKPGRMLEIGCGDGSFLAAAARKGWQAYGLDFDPAAVASARKWPGVTVEEGDLVNRRYPGEYFDAVVMNNVIEHIGNPKQLLLECNRIMRNGGQIVIITPNGESCGHELFGPDWRGLEVPRHLFVYTTRAIGSVTHSAGFPCPTVFTSPGGSTGKAMLASSRELARQAGRSCEMDDSTIASILRKEYIWNVFGCHKAEWVVLVGEKQEPPARQMFRLPIFSVGRIGPAMKINRGGRL